MQSRVGKYELKKLLGEGASAKVYLALDTYANTEVALKVLDKDVLDDTGAGESTRGQFLNEAALAGKLAHPHIVAILEAVMDEDSGYVAMEYVPGGNLARFTKPEGLLPVEDVIQIGFKSCSALDYAFRQGIVHRDIKPANILVVEGTNIKVADFGAALLKTVESTQDLVVGTPSYMSPEQITGAALTHHSDMYTMGVVLYELLTGQRPFGGDNLEALMAKILKTEPAPPSALRKELPQSIDNVVLRAMRKDPALRYPSWTEFALELSKAGELVLPPGAIPDSDKYVTLKAVPMLSSLADSELWELVRAGNWRRVPKGNLVVQEDAKGKSFFFLAKGEAKVIKKKKLLNMVNGGECFGEMAYIGPQEQPRHATVEAMTDLLLAEFEPAALDKMSLGAQLQLTRALVRNVVDRLALANVRLAR